MSIFSRRTLHRFINRFVVAGYPASKTEELVRKINSHSDVSLQAEWEIVAFAALDSFARIEYEPSGGGMTRPDFLVHDRLSRFAPVLLEVSSVSDSGLDDATPVYRLFDAIMVLARERGLHPNHLSISVAPMLFTTQGGDHPTIPVPSKRQFNSFIRDTVVPFLAVVMESPLQAASLNVATEDIHLEVKYDPSRKGAGLNYLSYMPKDGAARNPITNRLRKEAKQLRDANFAGPTGVLLCDAGFTRFGDDQFTERAVSAVLRANSSLSFVALVDVPQRSVSQNYVLRPRLRMRPNPGAKVPVSPDFEPALQQAINTLPSPWNRPHEAYRSLRAKPRRMTGSLYGRWSGNKCQVRLSARAVQMLLSGHIEMSEFMEVHHWADTPQRVRMPNPFSEMLRTGFTIAGVRLEHLPDNDDDWLIVDFSPVPDPAIAGVSIL